uniref:Mre11 DNA-binding domain-containing protein n=1 Tax=Aureoumbra lagunensis TaxID=44058 RepID=A0A7S3NI23_9STRA
MGSEEDIISIMITTDSHLGYCERDPVRMNDSFAAFEEVLKLSRENRVDMMLLGGDLFHDNKPSRRTMRNAVQLLEKYVLGDDPINFEIISDQKKIFGQDCNQVNYLHPHMSIALPIFSIHGNHDDPSRDGGPEALAALDLLSATRLINYFGCQDKVDDIHIKPILIKKGQTRIALYGLGNVRDERLNRSWDQNKVTFYRPAQDEASDIHLENHDDNLDTHHLKEPCARFFNILLLHQNRATMRAGVKTSIEERMIPKWMDLVIWGHEHECRIDFERSSQGRFAITQPGSTVATSLSPGEAIQKNCAIIQIKLDRIKMQTFPMTMIRTFIHDEFILANDEDLAESRDRGEIIDETNIVQVLQNKVESMVTQAKDNISIPRFSDQLFQLLQPELALIRLRVDHRGFPKVNAKNLGASFVQKLANPEQVLLFSRSSTTKKK